MKILVDCSSIRERPSGVGFYTYNLIKGFQTLQNINNHSLNLYRQPSLKQWLTNNYQLPESLQEFSPVKFLPFPVTISHLLGKKTNLLFPSQNHWQNIDIIHGTDHYVYPFSDGKKVMTIHDLTFLKFPFYSNKIVQNYGKRIKKCLAWTDLIITFSENTKLDIIEYLGVKKEKIAITSEASRYSFNYLNQLNIE